MKASRLFEIVPNLSEGRDAATIDAAAEAIRRSGARLIDRGSDAVHHRSVLTVVGSADEVLDAAVALAGIALERIDLRTHRGAHPRIGALDVLPFVPLTRRRSAGSGRARPPRGRRDLATLRHSFFLLRGGRPPERAHAVAGNPAQRQTGCRTKATLARHHSAGAIAIGARELLIAFNVELKSADLAAAAQIAHAVRERDGGLRSLRALAFPRRPGRVQVSLNVTDYAATPLYRVVELIRRLAADRGIELFGCELVGCLPWEAVEAAAAYYLGVSNL